MELKSLAKNTAAAMLLAAALAGCGLLGLGGEQEPEAGQPAQAASTEQQQQQQAAAVPVERLERPDRRSASDIEVLWEIPDQPVDGFIVRYGFSADSMPETVKLPADRFDKYEDPKHGFVYRYTVRNVPADKKVYLTVSAYQGEQESAPSGVFEVAP